MGLSRIPLSVGPQSGTLWRGSGAARSLERPHSEGGASEIGPLSAERPPLFLSICSHPLSPQYTLLIRRGGVVGLRFRPPPFWEGQDRRLQAEWDLARQFQAGPLPPPHPPPQPKGGLRVGWASTGGGGEPGSRADGQAWAAGAGWRGCAGGAAAVGVSSPRSRINKEICIHRVWERRASRPERL